MIDLHPRIAAPFPTPPGAVLRALHLLQILRRGDPDEIAAAGKQLAEAR